MKTGLTLAMIAVHMTGLALNPAMASQQLASDLGCYNCHGNPPKGKAPTFPENPARA